MSKFKAGDLIVHTDCRRPILRLVVRVFNDSFRGHASYEVILKETEMTFILSCAYFENTYRVLPRDSLEYAMLCPKKWL